MKWRALGLLVVAMLAGWGWLAFTKQAVRAQPAAKVLHVRPTEDFTVDGSGDAPAWKAVPWEPLALRVADRLPYQTRVKTLYSKTGLYVLMEAEDRTLTATMKEDFLDLWNEDVFEFFLWPDERYTVYFEYEISPLGYELPILIPNFEGKFLGWRPWHYEGKRRRRPPRGLKQPRRTGWKAEVYVPTIWAAFECPPKQDGGGPIHRVTTMVAGAPVGTGPVGLSFHEFTKFARWCSTDLVVSAILLCDPVSASWLQRSVHTRLRMAIPGNPGRAGPDATVSMKAPWMTPIGVDGDLRH
jgi:hypothetical protein